MKRVCLLGKGLNTMGWSPVKEILSECEVAGICVNSHEALMPCDLIVLLGYGRLLSKSELEMARLGTILFHSSDLPRGRGFAPIYNTIIQGLPLTQTLLFASERPDSGTIIAKARYSIPGMAMEGEVRVFDDYLTLILLERCLPAILEGRVAGAAQNEVDASWWPRRKPGDSKVDATVRISDVFNHLRALPAEAPPFFRYRGRRFMLRLEPMDPLSDFDIESVQVETFFTEQGWETKR